MAHYVESPTPSNERTCYTLLYTCRPVWICSRGQPGQIQHPSAVFRRVGKYVFVHNVALFGAWEEGSGRGPETGGDIEVRDRPRLVRVGARMDWGFETTAFEPQTYLVGPGRVDFGTFLCFFSGTSGNAYATPTEAPLLKSGVPDTPTHPLNCLDELGAQLEHNNYRAGFQHSGCSTASQSGPGRPDQARSAV